MAPQYEYPCAIIDALSGYLYLLDSGFSANNIVIEGTSAGGGLAMATILALREMKKPLPGIWFLNRRSTINFSLGRFD